MFSDIILGAVLAFFCAPNTEEQDGDETVRSIAGKIKKHFRTDVGKSTVNHMVKKHLGARKRILTSFVKKRGKRSGRPAKLSAKMSVRVVRYIRLYRGRRKVTSRLLKKVFKLDCTTQTILNTLLKRHEVK